MKNKDIIKDALGREVKDLSSIKWWGIERTEINWFPTINYDKCAGCGICFISCGRRVFDWDTEKDRPYVARPYNCMVACQTCANICPCGAITFPEIDTIRKLGIKAKIVKKAFEIIEPIRKREKIPSDSETQIKPEM